MKAVEFEELSPAGHTAWSLYLIDWKGGSIENAL